MSDTELYLHLLNDKRSNWVYVGMCCYLVVLFYGLWELVK